jgi:hypothetical protein
LHLIVRLQQIHAEILAVSGRTREGIKGHTGALMTLGRMAASRSSFRT